MAESAQNVGEQDVERRPLRDDRLLPSTRILAIVLVPILTLGFALLYFWPDETGDRFAWPISPEMTPLLMGGGYLSGAYYFARLALGRRFSPVGTTMPAVAAFATVMALATILHWENFTNDHLAFYAWTAVYFAAPPLVIAHWYVNRKYDPGSAAAESIAVPAWVRVTVGTLGAAVLALAAFMFLAPDQAADFWPWSISPLTSRVIAGWFTLSGTASVVVSLNRRWSVWRVPLETTFIWTVLILLGIPRAWDNFDAGSAATWLYLAGVILVILAILGLYSYMERRPAPSREYQAA